MIILLYLVIAYWLLKRLVLWGVVSSAAIQEDQDRADRQTRARESAQPKPGWPL